MEKLEVEASSSDETYHSTHNGLDLEKQETQTQSIRTSGKPTVSGAGTGARITRTQSLMRRNTTRGQFTHPLAHVKTSDAEIVDFEGPDDPYHPQNWPFRKKLITTLLYG